MFAQVGLIEWSLKILQCSQNQASAGSAYNILLYLLDNRHAVIGQFSGPYSTVQPAKSKTFFLRALFQDKEIISFLRSVL